MKFNERSSDRARLLGLLHPCGGEHLILIKHLIHFYSALAWIRQLLHTL